MSQPTDKEIQAAMSAVRAWLAKNQSFYNNMISDDTLRSVVIAAVTAVDAIKGK